MGKSPSELLMNRQPRIRFSTLRFKTSKQVVKVFPHNLDNKPKFKPDQPVFARNFGKGAKWVPGGLQKQSVQEILMFKLEIRCVSDTRNKSDLDSSLPTSVSLERLNNRSLMFWGVLRPY